MRGVSVGMRILVALAAGVLLATELNAERIDVTGRKRSYLMPKEDPNVGFTREQMEGKGLRNIESGERVINGELEDLIWRGRYVASIFRRNFLGLFATHCTAVVVHERVVMTAAHCVSEPNDYRVCVSSLNWLESDFCFEVTKVRVPDEFNLEFDPEVPVTHDIALLEVDGNLVANGSRARTIEIDIAPVRVRPNGKLGKIYGFGVTTETMNQTDDRLRKVDVFWQRFDFCIDDPLVVGKNFVCADGNYDGSRGGTCNGDSGGPLTWSKDGTDRPGQQVLVGIMSFGYTVEGEGPDSCDVEVPSAFTRINAWPITTWLIRTINELGYQFRIYRGPRV